MLTFHLAQELLARMSSGAASAEIGKLFSENQAWLVLKLIANFGQACSLLRLYVRTTILLVPVEFHSDAY